MKRLMKRYGKPEAVVTDGLRCPFTTTGARSVKLLKQGRLISYPGLPHGMTTTHADIINRDLLAFIRT